jgi:hypothetical protein
MLTTGAHFGRRGVGASVYSVMLATRVLQPAQPLGADGAALGRVLQQAGVGKASVVRVTGPAGLTAALWLGRHGFERAAYVRADRVGAMRTVDALIVPQAVSSQELAELIQGGECLRAGGVLIVQTAPGSVINGVDSLADLLERRISDKGREVCIARRLGQPAFRKAA